MRKVQIIAFAALTVALFCGSGFAQKKKTTYKKASQPLVAPLDVRTAREKVDIQLSNVNSFLNTLGPLSVSMEAAIADQKANKLKPATSKSIDQSRAKIVSSYRGMYDALANLESQFRTTPNLQKYRVSIQGITDLAGQAQDSANAGQFVASKDPLRKASQKLIDTLAVMPR